jgi:solute carrier family 25 thiamine pyrophosphate transporter 19
MTDEHQWRASNSQELLSGAVSSIIARFVIAPLDVIKIRLQVQGSPSASLIQYGSMTECIGSMWRTEGIRSFWKGNLSAELMVAPYGAISFWSHHSFKKLLFQRDDAHGIPEQQPLISFVCGALAGATATMSTYPLDLFRTRLAIQQDKEVYASLSHATKCVIQQDGIQGLYCGLWPTLLGVVPYMATQFTVYESLEAVAFDQKRRSGRLNAEDIANYERLGIGFVAGVLSKLLTLPFDVVKKRIQVDGFDNRIIKRGGLLAPFHMALAIVRQEGFRGLFRGCLPSLIKAGPNSATIFYTYNWCIESCRQWDDKHR